MAVYGFKVVSGANDTVTRKMLVKNSSTITKGDPVFLENAAGENALDLAAAAEPIYGIALETVTGNGTNKILVLTRLDDVIFEIDNDNVGNTFGATNFGGGNYFDITGATGAVLVDTSTGTTISATKALVCVDDSPDTGDVSLGHFKIVKSMLQA